MFTPKTALFTFFAACALGVVACQPTDLPAEPAATAVDAGVDKGEAKPSPEAARTASR